LPGIRRQGAGAQFSGNIWQHDPAHRRGVAYRDLPTRERFHAGLIRYGSGVADYEDVGMARHHCPWIGTTIPSSST
jgi:hypothetical protein